MNKHIQNLLRWIAVLPGATLAGILSTFVLHFLLYLILTKFVTPYPEFPERTLTPLFISISFIWTGSEIAPAHKIKVGIVLFSIWIFLAGGFIMSTLTGGKWFGNKLYLEARGVAPVLGIVGAFIGLYFVWKKNNEKQNIGLGKNIKTNDELLIESKTKTDRRSFYDSYGTDIFNVIFVLLFIWCIYYATGRYIIFIILLVLNLFSVFFSVKEKLYSTKTMKLNILKNVLMICLLIVGLFDSTTGWYVAFLCLLLQGFELIRHFIMTHFVTKNRTST